MKKRLLWISAILLAAVLYLFDNNAGTLTVFVGVLAVPVFGILPLLNKRAQVKMELNTAQEKGQTATGRLLAHNPGLLPMPRLKMVVQCCNLRTGEETVRSLELSLLPKQKKDVYFEFTCPYCGKIKLEVTEVTTADMFGLFARKLHCSAKAAMTILPTLFEPAISLDSHDMAMPDSDTYSPTRPGSDPGETFAIREYVPGDAIRKIHWKLSEKTDMLMVREFGLPVVNEVAILLETAGVQRPQEADAITEVLSSVSAALIGGDIHHHVFWRDHQTDELRDYNIAAEDDFTFMLEQLLELPPKGSGSVAQRFTELYPHCPYAHVIIVGRQIPQGISNLYNGNRVSILLPRTEHITEGLQPDGTHVLSFDIKNFAMDLCRLEV